MRPSDMKVGRSFFDRQDQDNLPQVHLIYALPSDGVDREYDLNGKIQFSVESANAWMRSKAKGKSFRFDQFQGQLDITFVRLKSTNAELKSKGVKLRDAIETELIQLKFNDDYKIYAVYYDGESTYSCALAPYPPAIPGKLFGLFLKGGGKGFNCEKESWATDPGTPKHREFSLLHEIIHSLGYVPKCALHFDKTHVSDSNKDLMYGGNDWRPSELDVGNDDYFNHQNKCPDLMNSPFLN